MKIYLASASFGRKKLLNEAKIIYEQISHNYDEIINQKVNNIEEYVLYIANKKMEYLDFSNIKNIPELFVIIVADTMNAFIDNEIIGKPINIEEARKFFIKMTTDEYSLCSTALCVSVCQKADDNKNYKIIEKFQNVSTTKLWISMSSEDIENYISIENEEILKLSSGLGISGYSASFFKKIEGSYTGVIGLQMYELKNILKTIENKYFK